MNHWNLPVKEAVGTPQPSPGPAGEVRESSAAGGRGQDLQSVQREFLRVDFLSKIALTREEQDELEQGDLVYSTRYIPITPNPGIWIQEKEDSIFYDIAPWSCCDPRYIAYRRVIFDDGLPDHLKYNLVPDHTINFKGQDTRPTERVAELPFNFGWKVEPLGTVLSSNYNIHIEFAKTKSVSQSSGNFWGFISHSLRDYLIAVDIPYPSSVFVGHDVFPDNYGIRYFLVKYLRRHFDVIPKSWWDYGKVVFYDYVNRH